MMIATDILESQIGPGDSGDPLAQARSLRPALEILEWYAGHLAETMRDQKKCVFASQISDLVNLAERAGVVQRDGMKRSGLGFVFNERALSQSDDPVTPETGLTTLRHIQQRTQRILNILDNAAGYTPRRSGRFYGDSVRWTPLIP